MVKLDKISVDNAQGFYRDRPLIWSSIGAFSIITGINGSGKTKLLEYIYNSNDYKRSCLIRYIDVDYRPPMQKHANEIRSKYQNSILIEDGEYYYTSKDSQERQVAEAYSLSGVVQSLDFAIIDEIIKERKEFQNNSIKLRSELDRKDIYDHSFDKYDLLPENVSEDQSWDRIDRILNAFGIEIRIDRMNLVSGLEFLRFNTLSRTETRLEMKDLSSGEKVAFALALWTWGNSKGQRTDVLLIDEFDAHLNPSVVQKFIAVIKEYFIDLGVQVIMTTHNPSTVAYAHAAQANIIWMNDGIIDSDMRYENIIRELSNGLIDINYLTEEMQLLVDNRHSTVVYMEGKTDKKHIDNAIYALGLNGKFSKNFVFGCTGADTVPFFLKLQTGQHKRIAILDSDDKGYAIYEQIYADPVLKKKIDSNSLSVIFISDEKGQVIEDLFEVGVRCIKNKEKFASWMSDPNNRTEKNYKNFSVLLEKIISTFS